MNPSAAATKRRDVLLSLDHCDDAGAAAASSDLEWNGHSQNYFSLDEAVGRDAETYPCWHTHQSSHHSSLGHQP